jgi:hypothetical protein
MRMSARVLSLGLTILPLMAACEDPTSAHGRREIGIVEWLFEAQANQISSSTAMSSADAPAVISAPDEVRAGVPFEATITTIGPAICWRADGADTQVSGNLAVVIPYDFSPETEDVACGAAIIDLPRTVKITFASPGEATLRVNGRKVVGGNTSAGKPTVVEKRILVR